MNKSRLRESPRTQHGSLRTGLDDASSARIVPALVCSDTCSGQDQRPAAVAGPRSPAVKTMHNARRRQGWARSPNTRERSQGNSRARTKERRSVRRRKPGLQTSGLQDEDRACLFRAAQLLVLVTATLANAGDETILCPHCGGGHLRVYICQNSLKCVHVVVYKLCFNHVHILKNRHHNMGHRKINHHE